jgi:Hydantoinase B/oxoprolinase
VILSRIGRLFISMSASLIDLWMNASLQCVCVCARAAFRYPVVLQQFSLRPSSGGKGLYNGGDGVIRELLFRKELTLSILSERRVHQPYGMKGNDRILCKMNSIQVA